MMKFSNVAQGTRARKRVVISEPAGPNGEPFIECDVVPLKAGDDAKVFEEARKFAAARGVADPKPGQEIYELGLWVHTIARSCLDCTVTDRQEPYFDGGVEQILHPDQGLMREQIAYLFEQQQAWQNECCPRQLSMNSIELLQFIMQHAEAPDGQDLPFERWPRLTQRTYVRIISAEAMNSPRIRSLCGLLSPEAPSSTSFADAAPSAAEDP
ncbi:MAG: hypothetical protein ACTHU0_01300 [Kofleriaceae bacterium]